MSDFEMKDWCELVPEKPIYIYAHLGCIKGVQKVKILGCDCDKRVYIELEDGSEDDSRWHAVADSPSNLPSDADGYLDYEDSNYKALNHKGIHKLILTKKEFYRESKKNRKHKKTTYFIFGVKGSDVKEVRLRNLQKAIAYLSNNTHRGYVRLAVDVDYSSGSSWNGKGICWSFEENIWELWGFKDSQMRRLDTKGLAEKNLAKWEGQS